MRIVSFDVFDTLLTRLFARPADLFRAVGETAVGEGLIGYPPIDFARQRLRAEVIARQTAPAGECRLSEIYDALRRLLNLSKSAASRICDLELDWERRSLKPVPMAASRVDQARTEADHLLFITDMYLPVAFIRELLVTHGFLQSVDRLYVSSEARASKASGELFERIRKDIGEISSWRHFGDNERADLVSPRSKGIDATLVPGVGLNRHEWFARGDAEVAESWRSLLAGSMRYSRLSRTTPDADVHRQGVWETGAGVAGPLLHAFIDWCLKEAEQRGIERLYFIARDGQVMRLIADRIIQFQRPPIQARYLYGSRQAWHPASILKLEETDLDWLIAPTRHLSIEQALHRMSLVPADFRGTLASAGFGEEDWDRNLNAEERERLGQALMRSPLREAVERSAAEKRNVLLEYLTQERFLDGSRIGIVDIGWHGNMQKSLARTLRAAGRDDAAKLTGFYLGIRPGITVPSDQTMLSFWPRDWQSSESDVLNNFITHLELFAAADHGGVVGFHHDNGGVVPLLQQPENTTALDWGLATFREALLAFVSTWLEHKPDEAGLDQELYALARRLFDNFCRHPSQREAAVWGAFHYSEEQIEKNFETMVPRMSPSELLRAILKSEHRPRGWWLEGTQAANPSLLLAAYIRYRYARTWLRRHLFKRA